MRHLGRATLAVIPFLLLVGGCNRQEVIPERLEGQVDRDLRYVQVKQNPDIHRGKLMLAGGEVLSATRVQEGTRIEVLQIPLSSDLVPDGDRSTSKGRFVAMDARKNVMDPAVLGDNKYITVVGEVVGSATIKIDEVEMQVPQLEVKNITVWDRDRLRPYAGFGYPYAYGRGYRGYYGYPIIGKMSLSREAGNIVNMDARSTNPLYVLRARNRFLRRPCICEVDA